MTTAATPDDEPDDQPVIPRPLSILTVISIAIHFILLGLACAAAKSPGHPGLPPDHAWDWYRAVGAAWSVGIGTFGLQWGAQATTRFGGTGSSARVGWCLAGVWLGYVWPVPVTAAAVAFAVWPAHRSRVRPLKARPAARIATILAAAAVAVLGSIWGVRAHAAKLHQLSGASASAVVGTWRAGGMTVTLRPDGTYSASDLSAADMMENEPFPPGAGKWELTESTPDGLDSVQLRPSPDRLLELPLYQASSVDYLCAEVDPDSPCDIVFHRV